MYMCIHIYIYIYIYMYITTQHSFGEESPGEDRLPEHHIRGWRAVSAERLQGEGFHERISYRYAG